MDALVVCETKYRISVKKSVLKQDERVATRLGRGEVMQLKLSQSRDGKRLPGSRRLRECQRTGQCDDSLLKNHSMGRWGNQQDSRQSRYGVLRSIPTLLCTV